MADGFTAFIGSAPIVVEQVHHGIDRGHGNRAAAFGALDRDIGNRAIVCQCLLGISRADEADRDADDAGRTQAFLDRAALQTVPSVHCQSPQCCH